MRSGKRVRIESVEGDPGVHHPNRPPGDKPPWASAPDPEQVRIVRAGSNAASRSSRDLGEGVPTWFQVAAGTRASGAAGPP